MNNFARVIRLSLRHRKTFIASLFCAVMLGVLCGANIGTILPVATIVVKNQSLQQWIDREIAKSEETVRLQTETLDKLHAESAVAPAEQQANFDSQIASAESRLTAEQKALARYEWMQPYVERYLPHDPFATLALFIGLLLLSTIVKDLFLVAHTVLVARLSESGTFALRKLFYRRTLKMDLASFHNEGTSDLMSRFTFDMETLTSGTNILFGKLIREPIKAVVFVVAAALVCWRLLLLSLVIAPIAALLMSLVGQGIETGEPSGDGGNGPTLQYARGDLPWNQSRQSLRHGTPRTATVPFQQQDLLPEGVANRAIRLPHAAQLPK